jgi:hypothetical protein
VQRRKQRPGLDHEGRSSARPGATRRARAVHRY